MQAAAAPHPRPPSAAGEDPSGSLRAEVPMHREAPAVVEAQSMGHLLVETFRSLFGQEGHLARAELPDRDAVEEATDEHQARLLEIRREREATFAELDGINAALDKAHAECVGGRVFPAAVSLPRPCLSRGRVFPTAVSLHDPQELPRPPFAPRGCTRLPRARSPFPRRLAHNQVPGGPRSAGRAQRQAANCRRQRHVGRFHRRGPVVEGRAAHPRRVCSARARAQSGPGRARGSSLCPQHKGQHHALARGQARASAQCKHGAGRTDDAVFPTVFSHRDYPRAPPLPPAGSCALVRPCASLRATPPRYPTSARVGWHPCVAMAGCRLTRALRWFDRSPFRHRLAVDGAGKGTQRG